jgi:hypothetical protein
MYRCMYSVRTEVGIVYKSRDEKQETTRSRAGGRFQRIPESLSALFKMVSFTAANTRRMLDVSVACVRLEGQLSDYMFQNQIRAGEGNILRIEVEMCPIDLIKPPKQVLRRLVDVGATLIVGEVIAQRRASQFLLEDVDLVEEQDNTGPHKPPRVDNGIEQEQTLHHAVLRVC